MVEGRSLFETTLGMVILLGPLRSILAEVTRSILFIVKEDYSILDLRGRSFVVCAYFPDRVVLYRAWSSTPVISWYVEYFILSWNIVWWFFSKYALKERNVRQKAFCLFCIAGHRKSYFLFNDTVSFFHCEVWNLFYRLGIQLNTVHYESEFHGFSLVMDISCISAYRTICIFLLFGQ